MYLPGRKHLAQRNVFRLPHFHDRVDLQVMTVFPYLSPISSGAIFLFSSAGIPTAVSGLEKSGASNRGPRSMNPRGRMHHKRPKTKDMSEGGPQNLPVLAKKIGYDMKSHCCFSNFPKDAI